jgi:2-polyprenyl-6-methoxyphenol hydroxylase-like FAD-dependent oxidoreductase
MALEDGWDLAEQLCKHESLEAALTAYDALSMPRAKTTLRMSHFVIEVAHSQGWRLMLYTLLFRILNRLLPYYFR